jgi:hypothetical protein
MNRRIAAVTIALVAVLGLAGCTGTPNATETEKSSSSTETSAPTEQSSGQTVAEACAIATSKVAGAASSLSSLDVNAAAADPEGTVATLTATADAIGEAADSVTNVEVKDAVTAVYEDFTTMRDLLSRVLIDKDTSAAAEMQTLATDIQTSTQAVSTLCSN